MNNTIINIKNSQATMEYKSKTVNAILKISNALEFDSVGLKIDFDFSAILTSNQKRDPFTSNMITSQNKGINNATTYTFCVSHDLINLDPSYIILSLIEMLGSEILKLNDSESLGSRDKGNKFTSEFRKFVSDKMNIKFKRETWDKDSESFKASKFANQRMVITEPIKQLADKFSDELAVIANFPISNNWKNDTYKVPTKLVKYSCHCEGVSFKISPKKSDNMRLEAKCLDCGTEVIEVIETSIPQVLEDLLQTVEMN